MRRAHPAADLKWLPDPPCRTESGAGSRKIYQAVADRVNHQFGGLVDAQRVHDVGAMYSNSVGAEIKHRGNFLVGFSFDDHLQNFKFARGQMLAAVAFQRGSDG